MIKLTELQLILESQDGRFFISHILRLCRVYFQLEMSALPSCGPRCGRPARSHKTKGISDFSLRLYWMGHFYGDIKKASPTSSPPIPPSLCPSSSSSQSPLLSPHHHHRLHPHSVNTHIHHHQTDSQFAVTDQPRSRGAEGAQQKSRSDGLEASAELARRKGFRSAGRNKDDAAFPYWT